ARQATRCCTLRAVRAIVFLSAPVVCPLACHPCCAPALTSSSIPPHHAVGEATDVDVQHQDPRPLGLRERRQHLRSQAGSPAKAPYHHPKRRAPVIIPPVPHVVA